MSPEYLFAESGALLGGTNRSRGAGAPGHPSVPPTNRTDRVGGFGRRSAPVSRLYAHRPALLEDSLALLALRRGSVVIDGTVGGGGHAAAILERTAPDGKLIGLEQCDSLSLETAVQPNHQPIQVLFFSPMVLVV